MILDFDTEHIRKHDISLLDCQVDLILRSLAFYKYTYEFIYPRRKENKSSEILTSKFLHNMQILNIIMKN